MEPVQTQGTVSGKCLKIDNCCQKYINVDILVSRTYMMSRHSLVQHSLGLDVTHDRMVIDLRHSIMRWFPRIGYSRNEEQINGFLVRCPCRSQSLWTIKNLCAMS